MLESRALEVSRPKELYTSLRQLTLIALGDALLVELSRRAVSIELQRLSASRALQLTVQYSSVADSIILIVRLLLYCCATTVVNFLVRQKSVL